MTTRDEIIEIFRNSELCSTMQYEIPGKQSWVGLEDEIVDFAKLVAAKEREACAKVCLSLNLYGPDSSKDIQFATLEDCATAIRNRSEE